VRLLPLAVLLLPVTVLLLPVAAAQTGSLSLDVAMAPGESGAGSWTQDGVVDLVLEGVVCPQDDLGVILLTFAAGDAAAANETTGEIRWLATPGVIPVRLAQGQTLTNSYTAQFPFTIDAEGSGDATATATATLYATFEASGTACVPAVPTTSAEAVLLKAIFSPTEEAAPTQIQPVPLLVPVAALLLTMIARRKV